jgi:hypothetical protein
MAPGTSLLPGRHRQLIDPADSRNTNSQISRLALVPVVTETYDSNKGPPSRTLARNWAAECGGLAIFDTYPSIMLVVEEAHNNEGNPRQSLEQKISRLRERYS